MTLFDVLKIVLYEHWFDAFYIVYCVIVYFFQLQQKNVSTMR